MTYYRYNDGINYLDEEDESIYLRLETYEVIKETKCGVWIRYLKNNKYSYDPFKFVEGKKFILEKGVNHFTRKRFAWPTKEEALASYIARKESQIGILSSQLNNAKEFYAKAGEMQNEDRKNKNII